MLRRKLESTTHDRNKLKRRLVTSEQEKSNLDQLLTEHLALCNCTTEELAQLTKLFYEE